MNKYPFLLSDYTNKLFRTLLGRKTEKDIAYETTQLHPGNEVYHPKALYVESDIAKIKGVAPSETLKNELQKIQAYTKIHHSSNAYRIKNIFLYDGNLFAYRYKHGFSKTKKYLLKAGFAEKFDQTTILSQTWLGSKFFGHFMLDDIPLNLLANQLGLASGVNRVLTEHQQTYSNLFGLKNTILPHSAYLRELVIIDDYHFNEHKMNRWQLMRNKLRRHTGNLEHIGVFLMRGDTGESRTLINEQEVAQHLEKMGFKCINPGQLTAKKVINTISNAKIVIGVEGSHLSHGLLGIANQGTMLVLQPPMRFSTIYKERCDIIGINFAFHVCEEHQHGFKADLNIINHLIEKVN